MTFPQFTSLTLNDKDLYTELVKDFPPVSDLSFSTLMIWWNFQNSAAISRLDNNLLINYELPGDKANSGLSLIGTSDIDVSLCAVFARQQADGQLQRLVHVPQFVVDQIENPDNFIITNERDYDEYIVPVSQLYPLDNLNHNMRRKVKKFLVATEGTKVEVKSLDLASKASQELLLGASRKWWHTTGHNDKEGNERVAMKIAVENAEMLEMHNVCLFINNELHGFLMYQISHDKQYAIMNHLKVSYQYPRIFEFLTYEGAGEVAKQGIPFANFEMDLGIEGLRTHKLELKPTSFFKKYTITPLQNA